MNAGHTPNPDLPDPETWLEEHGDALYRYAWLHLRDQSAAEDAVQDTLLAALSAWSTFAGKSSVRTWLIGILRHKILDRRRKAGREASESDVGTNIDILRDQFEDHGLWRNGPQRWGRHPDQALEQREFWDVLRWCLTELPPRMLAAFTARELDGRPGKDVCQDLGLTATNLWTLLHRARTALRKCLETRWFRSEAGPKGV
jgi:RNA polymerase sigma-70 factor (ECF subfamily)